MLTKLESDARTAEVTGFGEHARWTGVTQADREAWLAKRRELVTASEMAAVLGEVTFDGGDAFSVYHEKVTPKPDMALALDDPRLWGSALEWTVCQTVAQVDKWCFVRRGGALLESRRYPGLGATLDAEIIREEGGRLQPYEGKVSQFAEGWDEDEQHLPTAFLIQAQTQLMVTGAESVFVFGLIRGYHPKKITVETYAPFQQIILGAYQAFLELVRKGEPPPVTARSTGTLARLYPEDDGSTVLLPREAVEWTRYYQELLRQERTIKAAKEEIKNRLKDAIGSATFGELSEDVSGKGRWSWVHSEARIQPSHEVKAHRTLTQRKGNEFARKRARPAPRLAIAGVDVAPGEYLTRQLASSLDNEEQSGIIVRPPREVSLDEAAQILTAEGFAEAFPLTSGEKKKPVRFQKRRRRGT